MLNAYTIIKAVVVSEKSKFLQEELNQYAFKVDKRANKIQLSQAIKELFGVRPISINTANYKGKKKKYRMKKLGRKAHWKKAIVTFKKGDAIMEDYYGFETL